MRYLRNPVLAVTLLSILFLLVEWKNILHQPAPGTDFSIYYRAAGQFKQDALSLYLPPEAAWDQYLYPPPCILIFRFFYIFPEWTSYLLFIGVMYLCLIAALLIAQRLYEREGGAGLSGGGPLGRPGDGPVNSFPGKAGYLVFALASAPVYHNVGLGQIECLVLLLSLLYLYFFQTRPWLAGFLLAAAIWIKMYPVFLLVPACLSKAGRKTILTCFLAGIGIGIVSLPFVPFPLYLDFSKKLAAVSEYTSANIINQSFVAWGERTISPWRRAFDWPNIYQIPGWLKGVNYLLLGSVLVLACARVLKARAAWGREGIAGNKGLAGRVNPIPEPGMAGGMAGVLVPGAIMLAAGAVFSPLGWGHTFVLSLPLWVVTLQKIERKITSVLLRYAILLGLGLLLLIPVYNHPALLDPLPGPIQALYYSRFLCVTLLMIFYCMFESPETPSQKIAIR